MKKLENRVVNPRIGIPFYFYIEINFKYKKRSPSAFAEGGESEEFTPIYGGTPLISSQFPIVEQLGKGLTGNEEFFVLDEVINLVRIHGYLSLTITGGEVKLTFTGVHGMNKSDSVTTGDLLEVFFRTFNRVEKSRLVLVTSLQISISAEATIISEDIKVVLLKGEVCIFGRHFKSPPVGSVLLNVCTDSISTFQGECDHASVFPLVFENHLRLIPQISREAIWQGCYWIVGSSGSQFRPFRELFGGKDIVDMPCFIREDEAECSSNDNDNNQSHHQGDEPFLNGMSNAIRHDESS